MVMLDWVGLLGLIGVSIVLANRRTNGAEDYLLAGRRVGLFPLVATLVMTEFNTSTLIAFSALGYRVGPMAIGLSLVFLVGLGWYTLTVARAWKRFNRLSVAEFFTLRYGPGLGRFASLLLLLAMLGFSATYVKSMTMIFTPWIERLGLSPAAAGLILTGLVAGMTLSGGLPSIVRADVVALVLTVALAGWLLATGLIRHEGVGALHEAFPDGHAGLAPIARWNHPVLPTWFVLSLVVLTCFTYISSPWYGQKIFAARSERVAFLAVAIASVVVFLLYASFQFAAAFYRLEPGELADDQAVLSRMVDAWLPPGVRGMAYAVLFLAAMTTLAGVWSAMVSLLVADFAPRRLASLRARRTATVTLAFLAWLGANLLVDDILDRLILANIPIAALAFALLGGFHWPRASRFGAWASVLVGIVWGTGCFAWFGDAGGYTWPWAIYGIPLVFGSGVLGSLLFPDATPRECGVAHRNEAIPADTLGAAEMLTSYP